MAKNFSELQNAIRVANDPVAQTRLLSITVDPQFDTPAVLKEYAQQEGADPKVWSFAPGAPAEIDALVQSFAVYRQNEGGSINHGLTTALIDREGKIVKIWHGNGWKPREVVESLNSIDHGAPLIAFSCAELAARPRVIRASAVSVRLGRCGEALSAEGKKRPVFRKRRRALRSLRSHCAA